MLPVKTPRHPLSTPLIFMPFLLRRCFLFNSTIPLPVYDSISPPLPPTRQLFPPQIIHARVTRTSTALPQPRRRRRIIILSRRSPDKLFPAGGAQPFCVFDARDGLGGVDGSRLRICLRITGCEGWDEGGEGHCLYLSLATKSVHDVSVSYLVEE